MRIYSFYSRWAAFGLILALSSPASEASHKRGAEEELQGVPQKITHTVETVSGDSLSGLNTDIQPHILRHLDEQALGRLGASAKDFLVAVEAEFHRRFAPEDLRPLPLIRQDGQRTFFPWRATHYLRSGLIHFLENDYPNITQLDQDQKTRISRLAVFCADYDLPVKNLLITALQYADYPAIATRLAESFEEKVITNLTMKNNALDLEMVLMLHAFNYDAPSKLITPAIVAFPRPSIKHSRHVPDKILSLFIRYTSTLFEQGYKNISRQLGEKLSDTAQYAIARHYKNKAVQYAKGEKDKEEKRSEQYYQEAIYWWQRMIKRGSPEADHIYYSLGKRYEQGQGVKQDYKKALEYYQEADKRDNEMVLPRLGQLYELGWGVEPDYTKALECYLKAIYGGSASAIKGFKRLQDKPDFESIMAKVEDVKAQTAIGEDYKFGLSGLFRGDVQKASQWFEKAANQGYADAQYWLAKMYAKGQGVSKNLSKAWELANLAKQQDHCDAPSLLSKLQAMMEQ